MINGLKMGIAAGLLVLLIAILFEIRVNGWEPSLQSAVDAVAGEPQIWFMITPRIAVGGEVEIDKNFPAGPAGWQLFPTLGFRWEF
jgi:hypothetical protein